MTKDSHELNDDVVEIIRNQLETLRDFDQELQRMKKKTQEKLNCCLAFYKKCPDEYMKAIKSSRLVNDIRLIEGLVVDKKGVQF